MENYKVIALPVTTLHLLISHTFNREFYVMTLIVPNPRLVVVTCLIQSLKAINFKNYFTLWTYILSPPEHLNPPGCLMELLNHSAGISAKGINKLNHHFNT